MYIIMPFYLKRSSVLHAAAQSLELLKLVIDQIILQVSVTQCIYITVLVEHLWGVQLPNITITNNAAAGLLAHCFELFLRITDIQFEYWVKRMALLWLWWMCRLPQRL